MTNKVKYLAVLFLILTDQISKVLVLRYFPKIAVINQNGSFSLVLGGVNYIYISFIALLLFVLILFLIEKKALTGWGFILILSGAISNIVDRLRLDGVVEFFHSSFWPTFNIADSFITIGAIILIIELVLQTSQKSA